MVESLEDGSSKGECLCITQAEIDYLIDKLVEVKKYFGKDNGVLRRNY